MRRNLSCGKMFPHDRLLHKNKLALFCCKICFVAIYAVQSRNLFCRETCFVAIYALLCGEKLNQTLCLWRKNDKYQVWSQGHNFGKTLYLQVSQAQCIAPFIHFPRELLPLYVYKMSNNNISDPGSIAIAIWLRQCTASTFLVLSIGHLATAPLLIHGARKVIAAKQARKPQSYARSHRVKESQSH